MCRKICYNATLSNKKMSDLFFVELDYSLNNMFVTSKRFRHFCSTNISLSPKISEKKRVIHIVIAQFKSSRGSKLRRSLASNTKYKRRRSLASNTKYELRRSLASNTNINSDALSRQNLNFLATSVLRTRTTCEIPTFEYTFYCHVILEEYFTEC